MKIRQALAQVSKIAFYIYSCKIDDLEMTEIVKRITILSILMCTW